MSLVHRDAELRTDILTSAILDFGTARWAFTMGTQSHLLRSAWMRSAQAGSSPYTLPFNAYPDTPLLLSVNTGVGARKVFTPAVDQYVEMFEAFSRAVREGGAVPTPPQDAIDNMKVLDALFRSEKSGAGRRSEEAAVPASYAAARTAAAAKTTSG